MEELKDELEGKEWELKKAMRMERVGNEVEGGLTEYMSERPSRGAHISYRLGPGG